MAAEWSLMVDSLTGQGGIVPPTGDKTFSDVLGQAVWLMSMDKDYKHLPIGMIEGRVLPPIILRRFKLYYREKQPIAFLTWALLDEASAANFDPSVLTGNDLQFWSAGTKLAVIDCVSPFVERAIIEEAFLKEFAPSQKGGD